MKKHIDMITASGHVVYFPQPDITPVDPVDLRIHTINICRYNGALKWELSRHLALCGTLLTHRSPHLIKVYRAPDDPTENDIQAAFCVSHDFHEIYCTDVVSGLKKYLPEYRKIESAWEQHVHTQLGLPLEARDHELIKHVDLRALVIEMTMLKHPAANLVAKRYGGKTTNCEERIFKQIAALTPEEAWVTAWKIFLQGRNAFLAKNTELSVELF